MTSRLKIGLALWVAYWLVVLGIVAAHAVECPTPGQPCKVLFLSPQEEAILIQDKGVLASAAEARKVDLDAVALYFRRKIESAPQGEVKPVEQPKQGQ